MNPLLSHPTLVLNQSWQPVNVTSVQRALILLVNDIAFAVDPATYQLFSWEDWCQMPTKNRQQTLKSSQLEFPAPEILSLKRFNKLPGSSVSYSKRNILKRDRYTCQYCGRQPAHSELTIDHVIPRSMGGKSCWENCVVACVECNHRKADHALSNIGMKLLSKPEKPLWQTQMQMTDAQPQSWLRFLSHGSVQETS